MDKPRVEYVVVFLGRFMSGMHRVCRGALVFLYWCLSCQKLSSLVMFPVISYSTMELVVFSSELMHACIFNINGKYFI